MAAIDKIYLNYSDSKEFLAWIKKHDNEFVEEFKESKCPSMLEFFYYTNVDERFEDGNYDSTHPICMLPELVEKWVLRFEDLPAGAKEEICFNYGLETEEQFKEFTSGPLEKIDTRPIGKHLKIISRSGWFVGRNDGNIYYDIHSRYYYANEWARRNGKEWLEFFHENPDIDNYTKSLIDDVWWYDYDNGIAENTYFKKKRCIYSGRTSMFGKPGTNSVKSIIRQILKQDFPIGTIIRIYHFRYEGEIICRITK